MIDARTAPLIYYGVIIKAGLARLQVSFGSLAGTLNAFSVVFDLPLLSVIRKFIPFFVTLSRFIHVFCDNFDTSDQLLIFRGTAKIPLEMPGFSRKNAVNAPFVPTSGIAKIVIFTPNCLLKRCHFFII